MSVRHKHLLLLSVLASCVSYERDDTDAQSIAAEIGARTGGTYSIDEAVVLALHQNAELRAAVASVRAAGGERTVPLPARTNWRGRAEAVEILLDPIALLGLGPRGAAIDAAHARHAEAVAQLTVTRWRVVAAVAEEFQIHAALNQLNVVDLKLDVGAFERAGLASTVAAQQLRAAQLRATSERAELRRAHNDNRARLRELLGLPDHAALTITTMTESWLQQPRGAADELLSRPDLLLAAARFEVADRDFRKAVSDQYPSLQIGPNISLVGDPLRAMGMLK
ncbi:MAG TPA: TolC family protein, partial [Planctomycetes bacterium]|nr:TolC family protein [Planctomycetota bacterium]